ncbi:MAG: polysaccharide pyruvyl transferase family protein [Lachnospiraceae bacterium]|nr:polysaccharide pyruvyl transferase family protein [Lachnospiraceae bacterium]
MKSDEIVLYMHAGSDNHGCEAIANTLIKMLPKPAALISSRKAEDEKYSLPALCKEIIQENAIEKNVLIHTWYYLWRKIFKDPECYMRYRYRKFCGKNMRRVNISIGGDNYCYKNMIERLVMSNRMFHHGGAKTVLYGCSIEPEILKSKEIVEDMRRYDMIVARESITYEALRAAGIEENVFLCPDPAFLLETEYLPLPADWREGKMVGINLSPMVMDNEKRPGITMESYKALVNHILKNTDFGVALIPHVVWTGGDDRGPLNELYEMFKGTGRIVQIQDASALQLKGYISRCRMFIGARTHATIAAYSSAVPTLVIGYSVKARGIAKDLFGTDEKYVLPVQRIQNEEELIEHFEWLRNREKEISGHLQKVMPEYKKRAVEGGKLLEKI